MQLTIDDELLDDGRTLVTVAGEVDIATGPQLRQRLLELAADGRTRVIIEASQVSFIDSTGLGVLVGALKRLRQSGGDLTVVSSSPPVKKILEITGLLDVFKFSDSMDGVTSP